MSEWVEKPLGQLAKFQKGRKVETSEYLQEGFDAYLGAPSLEKGNIDGFASTKLAVLANPNDVLVLWDGERSGLVGHGLSGVVSSTVSRITSGNEITGSYLYYHLLSRFEWIQGRRTGTGVPHVPKDLSRILSVNFPRKINEQERITKVLASVDVAIERTEALIEKYQQIKAGLMHDLFTRGIGADGKLRPPREQAPELYQQTPIGWIPKEWQYELLDNLAIRGSGHTPNKNFPEYWNGGIKWISLADSFRLDRLYIEDTEYEISQLGIQNSSAVLHPAGVVVLSRDAGVGKSAITTQPMAVSQHFMCWRCDDRLDKHFLYYWLQFKKRTFENIAMGSTILTIGLSYFKKLKITAPVDLDEQQNIGRRMQSADKKIFALENELQKLKQQKSGLMHDLLTGKVRVKLSEPSPEMADG
jgi:type I restriction enzyme S subunit